MQQARKSLINKVGLLLIVLAVASCDSFTSVPQGRIRIKNSLSGKDFSSYSVSGGGSSFYLQAGEDVLLPPGTRSFSISYPARDGQRSYQVECPSNAKLGITVRLLDVHSNKIAGGCETVGGSRSR